MQPPNSANNAFPILGAGQRHQDPVCGMTVDPTKAAAQLDHSGKIYYFCSKKCAQRFAANPDRFLAAAGTGGMKNPDSSYQHHAVGPPKQSSENPDARYTCPMHPEVVQFGPGTCPKCGMALEAMD